MAKCTCVWDGNRLTKPRFPSCSPWHLDPPGSVTPTVLPVDSTRVPRCAGWTGGVHSEQISRASAKLVRMRFLACQVQPLTSSELNGQDHATSSTRSVHLKHEKPELWDISILFSGAEPSTEARNPDLCTKTEAPDVSLNNIKPSAF